MDFSDLRTVTWETFSAIGTLAAVILSLWLARPKLERRICITQVLKSNYNKDSSLKSIQLIYTIENIGNVALIIDDLGFLTDDNVLLTNEALDQLKESTLPLIIRPNEAEKIVAHFEPDDFFYEYNKGRSLAFRDSRGRLHKIKRFIK